MTIVVIWVMDGIDQCHVGFLPCHMVVHAKMFDGALAQMMKVLSGDAAFCNSAECCMFHQNKGCCMAAVISTTVPIANKDNRNGDDAKKRKADTCDDY